MIGFIYFAKPRELGANVFKVGRTCDISQRMQAYGGQQNMLLCCKVSNLVHVEKLAIHALNLICTRHRIDIGYEYFEFSDFCVAIETIHNVCKPFFTLQNIAIMNDTHIASFLDIHESNFKVALTVATILQLFKDFCNEKGILCSLRSADRIIRALKSRFTVEIHNNTFKIVDDIPIEIPSEFLDKFAKSPENKLSKNYVFKRYLEYCIESNITPLDKNIFCNAIYKKFPIVQTSSSFFLHGYIYLPKVLEEIKTKNIHNNPVAGWLKENYELTFRDTDIIAVDVLYNEFSLERQDIKLTKKRFGLCMGLLNFKNKTHTGNKRVYTGLKIKPRVIEQLDDDF